MKGGAV